MKGSKLSNNEQHSAVDDVYAELENLRAENARLVSAQKFGLVWEDKPDEQVLKFKNDEYVMLREDPARAVVTDANAVNHILINGDNFHALAALQATHRGKVDVIYIDPPYNTGNKDFIYNDHYLDKDDIYRHSKWLSFMEKRLRLAAELLHTEGVIFASIDDSEHARLKLLMDEIFGPDNFVSNVVWNSTAGSNTGNLPVSITESILVYAKNIKKVALQREPFVNDGKMKLTDEHFERRGLYAVDKLDSRRQSSHYTESLNYQMEMPDGTLLYPGGKEVPTEGFNWLWSKSKVEWGKEAGFIVFKQGKNGWTVYNKRYELVNNKDEISTRGQVFKNLITSAFATTSTGSKEIKAIGVGFDYPKPTKLIKRLVNLHSKKNAVVLDFFAGSGTTTHAVAELNKEDDGRRSTIIVTDGGKSETTGHSSNHGAEDSVNIAEEVTYERVRRALTGNGWADSKEHDSLDGNLRYFTTELHQSSELDVSKFISEFAKIESGLFRLVESYDQKDNRYKIYSDNVGSRHVAVVESHDEFLESLEAWVQSMDHDDNIRIFAHRVNDLAWIERHENAIGQDLMGEVIEGQDIVRAKL